MIQISKTTQPKAKPDTQDLGFGRFFSDHVFSARYNRKTGWAKGEIKPYGDLQIDPGASVLHYGQALFEGLKAFKQKDSKIVIFRPDFNWKRMTAGADRLCMEAPPQELFTEGIKSLVRIDQDWIPTSPGSSLYIRPTLIGTEAFLGVRPADEFLFFVMLSPVGSYYAEGSAPIKIWVETEYIRAAPGGLGATKAAANYAASLKAALEAKKKSYSQVLWLDVTHKYVEEVGTMNVFFVFKNEIVTPSLDGTILGGGVRDSLIQILKEWKLPIVERKLSLDEIRKSSEQGDLLEAFGSGTAAVISPIGELAGKDFQIQINNGKKGPLAQKLYDEITELQNGLRPDHRKWLVQV